MTLPNQPAASSSDDVDLNIKENKLKTLEDTLSKHLPSYKWNDALQRLANFFDQSATTQFWKQVDLTREQLDLDKITFEDPDFRSKVLLLSAWDCKAVKHVVFSGTAEPEPKRKRPAKKPRPKRTATVTVVEEHDDDEPAAAAATTIVDDDPPRVSDNDDEISNVVVLETTAASAPSTSDDVDLEAIAE